MSDMWQVPEGLAESLLKRDPCADARSDAWKNGVQAGMEYVGAMMMDLISELRDRQERLQNKSAYPSELLQEYDFVMSDIADRAERRLRNAINE